MDIESARQNMVDCQIKTWDVFDLDVIEAFLTIKREDFVPTTYKKLAFADTSLDLDDNQTMMSPKLEARLLQALSLTKKDKVLEVGTGTGHMTALLSVLSKEVVSFECRSSLFEKAKSNLEKANIKNTTLLCGNGLTEFNRFAPFDAVVFSGSLPKRDKKIEESLAIEGRMFAIIGTGDVMEAILIQRISVSDWHSETLFETSAEILQGAEIPPVFRFE